jgi:hypothetical protein
VRLDRCVRLLCVFVITSAVLFGQEPQTAVATEVDRFHWRAQVRHFAPDLDADANAALVPKDSVSPAVQSGEIKRTTFDWAGASEQSFFFLGIQHGFRMVQRKTRTELDGKFWHDYANAVSGLGGWGDTDSVLTNYGGHPMMGAVTGWIQIQNDPNGIGLQFDPHDPAYWRSRLKAMGWAAFYSTQFELGPISEASIGNVGRKRGTMGYVDLVMTPVGGMGWIVAEDATDKHFIKKLEDGRSDGMKRFVRIFFNPNRSLANVLRFKKPWHRDTRSMSWDAR